MGSWGLFTIVTSMVEVARVGFIKYGFIKLRAAAAAADQDKLFTAALTLNLIFALLVSIGMLIFGGLVAENWKSPELRVLFYWYSITSIVLVPFFQFEYLQHALLDFRSVFLVYFIRNGFLFFTILFSYLGFYKLDLITLVITNLSCAFVGSLSAYFLIQKPIHFSLSLDKIWIWKLVHFGKFAVGTSLVATLYGSIDQMILASLASTATVAIYGTALRITNLINVPSMSLSAIIFPHSARLINTEGKAGIKTLYEKSVAAILAIVLPGVVFVLLFPGFVIFIIAGAGYSDSVAILQITIYLSFFLPFAYQFGVTLDSIGYPNLNFYFTGSFFVINLSLNYFLVSKYGIIGAAYGTLSTTIFGFIAMQVLLRFMLGVNILNVFRNMVGFYITSFNGAKGLVMKTQ